MKEGNQSVNSQINDIFTFIDAHREEYIKELIDFISIESTASQKNEREKARVFIEKQLQKTGLPSHRLKVNKGNDLLTSEKQGLKQKTVLFYNHYDVVEAGDPSKWDSGKPFALTEKGDFLYGRGVSDNKGPLLSRIQAIRAILSVTGTLPVTIKYLFEGDEESGSPSMMDYVENHPALFREACKADICFWENGRRQGNGGPWARYGVRGNCSFDISVKTATKDVHGRMGSIVPSASWRLIWALASLQSPDGKIKIKGFYDNIETPTEYELKILRDFPYNEEFEKEKLGLAHFVNHVSGLELKKQMYFTPTMSICGLESGQMYIKPRGIVPHDAHARLSCYLVANQDPNRIATLLQEHFKKIGFSDIKVDYLDGTFPVKTSMEIPETACLEKAALLAYNKPLVKEITQLGAGPAIALRRVIPDLKIIGIGPGNTNSNHHSPNENLKVDDYIRSMKFIVAFLYEYSNQSLKENDLH